MGERHRHTIVVTAMIALCWLAPAAGEDVLVLTTESGVRLALQHNERIMLARSERISERRASLNRRRPHCGRPAATAAH